MADRFYISFAPTQGTVVLQGPEARHLAKIMRAKPGDRVSLFCGDGLEYRADVVAIGRRDVTLEVIAAQKPERELPFRLEVAAAFPKGDRGEFLIEKLTELGVTRFVPLMTQRSIVKPKIEKLQRCVIESSKQCGRNVLMEISDIMAWEAYCQSTAVPKWKWMAHPNDHSNPWMPRSLHAHHENSVVAVGPEGGWTDEEIKLAMNSGWQLVGLGPRILRIETAAITLAAYFAHSSSINA